MSVSNATQTRANHTRLDPPFHFVLIPLLLIFMALSVSRFVRQLSVPTFSLALLSVALLIMALIARTYALKVQNRLIRLEERLRMATLLPENLRFRAAELTIGQYVALRFAGDDELPALVRLALDEHLNSSQIKARIVSWRPDYYRV